MPGVLLALAALLLVTGMASPAAAQAGSEAPLAPLAESCPGPPVRRVDVQVHDPHSATLQWSVQEGANVTGTYWLILGEGRRGAATALWPDDALQEARLTGLLPAADYGFELVGRWRSGCASSGGNIATGTFSTPQGDIDPASAAALGLPMLAGLGLIGLAAMVARTGWQHTHNRVFSALYLLSGLKSMTDGMLAVANEEPHRLWADLFHAGAALFPPSAFWLRVNEWCGFLMIPLLFLFVSRFPRPAAWVIRHPWWQVLPFVVVPLFALLAYTLPPDPTQLIQLPTLVVASAGTTVTVLALVVLVRTRQTSPSPIERRQATYILLGWLPAFLATWVITALLYVLNRPLPPETLQQTYEAIVFTGSYASPVLELVAAFAVAFAILKYRILEFELQVKGGMKYLVMTLSMSTILFLAATWVGNFILQNKVFSFAGPEGSAVLAGVGGMLLFKPVEKLSAKATDRMFPDTVRNHEEYARRRAHDIYLAQVTHVLRDGHVTAREWSFLHGLRDQLGLTAAGARAVEEEAERQVGVDIASLGASATPPVRPAPTTPTTRAAPSTPTAASPPPPAPGKDEPRGESQASHDKS